mgnify:CR=1 FL=1
MLGSDGQLLSQARALGAASAPGPLLPVPAGRWMVVSMVVTFGTSATDRGGSTASIRVDGHRILAGPVWREGTASPPVRVTQVTAAEINEAAAPSGALGGPLTLFATSAGNTTGDLRFFDGDVRTALGTLLAGMQTHAATVMPSQLAELRMSVLWHKVLGCTHCPLNRCVLAVHRLEGASLDLVESVEADLSNRYNISTPFHTRCNVSSTVRGSAALASFPAVTPSSNAWEGTPEVFVAPNSTLYA